MDDITVILAVIGTASGIIGGVYSYLAQRRQRQAFERLTGAQADGAQIENLTHLLEVVNKLRQQRRDDFEEILALKNEVSNLRTTVTDLQAGRSRDRRIIDTALKHIEELRKELKKAGITPPPWPTMLQHWREDYELNGDDDE